MHVFLGLLITIGAFAASAVLESVAPPRGLANPAALTLLVLGPVGVTLFSHPFRSLRQNFAVVRRAFAHDRRRSLEHASREMGEVARAVREARWSDAEQTLAGAQGEQVKLLAPYLLERLEAEALHEAVASAAFGWMSEVKAADDLLQGLARYAPAFGMIGTIMGLVDLFENLDDSASLGPGMAMALLATLYGLVLCYCVTRS
ncbi:MAG: MotA/TolQ/ExbB proton channel family protein, partial [Myxococcota bacterium]